MDVTSPAARAFGPRVARYAANREIARARAAERARAWRLRHKVEIATYAKKKRADNPDVFRERYKRWIRNATGQKALQKRWREEHPARVCELHRIHNLSRRARKAAVYVERVDPNIVFDRDKGVCGICFGNVERNEPWHVDHVIPIAKGGEHSYRNVQLAHATCNLKKNARLVAA